MISNLWSRLGTASVVAVATLLWLSCIDGQALAQTVATPSTQQPIREYRDGVILAAPDAAPSAGVLVTNDGRVGVGTLEPDPGARLDVVGVIRAEVIEIIGGSDLAEPFPLAGEGAVAPEPGTLVCISETHPGGVEISSREYDPRIVGVVSGALGVQPGLVMRAQGEPAVDGTVRVALTGRVYVRASASNGPIAPGDLLTSSALPGCAMRATDLARARGAAIGKAMSRLDGGEGYVLLLVQPQ